MSADIALSEALQQLVHQQAERTFLFRCTGICRMSVAIQSTLIADAYRVGVVPLGMCPYLFQGASGDGGAIPADVLVITDAMEATAAMF